MPIPTPKSGESEANFIKRCMASSIMTKDYPNQQQRVAVCNSQLKKGENMEPKLDEQGRKIIAENVNIIFTGDIEESEEE